MICNYLSLCNTYIGVTLTFFIILVESEYLVMNGVYKGPFFRRSLSLSFLSSLDLLSSTIRDNYNKYYIYQSILSILSFSKKPHHELTG